MFSLPSLANKVIPLWVKILIILAVVAAIVFGASRLYESIKESGREEARADCEKGKLAAKEIREEKVDKVTDLSESLAEDKRGKVANYAAAAASTTAPVIAKKRASKPTSCDSLDPDTMSAINTLIDHANQEIGVDK